MKSLKKENYRLYFILSEANGLKTNCNKFVHFINEKNFDVDFHIFNVVPYYNAFNNIQ